MSRNFELEAAMAKSLEIKGAALSNCMPVRFNYPEVQAVRKAFLGKAYGLANLFCSRDTDYRPLAVLFGSDPELSAFARETHVVISFHMAMRHMITKSPIFTVNQNLWQLLSDTKIKSNVPVRFFAAPYSDTYIEFNSPEYRAQSEIKTAGGYICEGCYIQENKLDKLPEMSQNAREILELDPNKPCREILVGFTGSPVGTASQLAYLDQVDVISLLVQDEDEPLIDVFNRTIELEKFKAIQAGRSFDHVEKYAESALGNITAVAKVLFYMNVEKREIKKVDEATQLRKRLVGVADKKARKIKQQLDRAYDRLIIGPESYTPLAARIQSGNVAPGTRAPHFRRGYFGIRYKGTGQAKVPELVRISAAEINRHLMRDGQGPTKAKNYEIR
ncbi:hypothetical protein ACYPKM_03380 [Pseudomonas aeruginosa]